MLSQFLKEKELSHVNKGGKMVNLKKPATKPQKARGSLKANFKKAVTTNIPSGDALRSLDYSTIMRLIDNGMDDFNSATPDCCLSLILGARYMGIISALETMQDQHFQPAARLLPKYRLIYKNLRKDFNDVLRIYQKLKNSARGLNKPVLEAYESEYPNANIQEQLKKMDSHLIHKPHFSCPALRAKGKAQNA